MKRLIACILALIMILSVAACAKQQEAPAPTEETKTASVPVPVEPAQKVIHVLVPADTAGWQAKAAAAATEAAETIKAAGKYDTVVSTYTDAAAQRKLLEDLAAQSTKDGSLSVVLMPAAADMDDVLAKLLEANVSYALAKTIPETAAAASLTNVSYDQQAIGAAVAAYMVQEGLTEDQRVVLIQGVSSEETLRSEGFRLYLQGKLSHDGKLIEAPWSSLNNLVYSEMEGQTQESAEAYFTTYMQDAEHADTKYIVAWEDIYVMGILSALNGENMDEDYKAEFLEGQPVVATCGGSQAIVDVLADAAKNPFGKLQVAAYSADLLKIAVEAMAAHFDGTVVPQENLQSIVWINGENASQYQGY